MFVELEASAVGGWNKFKSFVFKRVEDKRVVLLMTFVAFLIVSLLKTVGLSLPLNMITIRIPFFIEPNYVFDDSIPSATTWLVLIFCLSFKLLMIIGRYGLLAPVVFVPVTTGIFSFLVQYAHFVHLHDHTMLALIASIIFQHK